MTTAQNNASDTVQIAADVLVIGGGMAAAWAAIGAANAGAAVVLVDKGYVGSSGVTATGGPGHWWVPPDQELRREAVARRYATSFGLADPAWMERIIDTTWRNLPELDGYYDFQTNAQGEKHYQGLRGPEYMRALRHKALDAGVVILDQSPALELLVHRDGSIAGAQGVRRLDGRHWSARAGAVVLATGGCAFRSGLLGSHTNTGDGYLMAAEAGAELSGMEFSAAYSVSPVWNSTRVAIYTFARYMDADGRPLDFSMFGQGSDFAVEMAKALQAGPVYCLLDEVPEDVRTFFPQVQPATPLSFVRRGIDLYSDKFEVTLFAEGTIRGTGGLRITDGDCSTNIPGLFAAGDAATRELVAGATSGGGAQNSAWALSSGLWAGAGAAARSKRLGRRDNEPAIPTGGAGLRPTSTVKELDVRSLIRNVQEETLPFDKLLFRTGTGIERSIERLQGLWSFVRSHQRAQGLEAVRAREAAAMLATARWCHAAALARRETRGMHRRLDATETDPLLDHRLLVGGLDTLWVKPDTATAERLRA